ncbi:MAG TPA: beta-eliminating lyase-related protein, partial [Actinomycetota bacterium]|nr:beta-eliminating lyase-related protein [Actinomycetota bacterium]
EHCVSDMRHGTAYSGVMMHPGPDHGAMTLQKRARAARQRADRALTGRISGPVQNLRELTGYLDNLGADTRDWDHYGEGGPVAELETRVANLVGKPAAAMFPSGVMAQQAMLRVWCEQRGSSRVALPDLSHLLRHELDGPLCAKRGWRCGMWLPRSCVMAVATAPDVGGRRSRCQARCSRA